MYAYCVYTTLRQPSYVFSATCVELALHAHRDSGSACVAARRRGAWRGAHVPRLVAVASPSMFSPMALTAARSRPQQPPVLHRCALQRPCDKPPLLSSSCSLQLWQTLLSTGATATGVSAPLLLSKYALSCRASPERQRMEKLVLLWRPLVSAPGCSWVQCCGEGAREGAAV